MIFLKVLALIYLANSVISDFSGGFTLEKFNGCADNDGWESFDTKIDRCIGYFEDVGSKTYKMADEKCQKLTHSSKFGIFGYPVIINNERDQKRVEKFLKSRKIDENIWLGLRKCKESTGTCGADYTAVTYANWVDKIHNPYVDYCVQMIAHGANFGKWQQVSCGTSGLVVCENKVIWEWEQLQIKVRQIIHNMNFNILPIGMTYMQLERTDSPNLLWPWATWLDVSHEYAKNSTDSGIVEGRVPKNVRIWKRIK